METRIIYFYSVGLLGGDSLSSMPFFGHFFSVKGAMSPVFSVTLKSLKYIFISKETHKSGSSVVKLFY